MEERIKTEDLLYHVLDPQTILPEMPTDKVRILLVELDMIMEDYKRDLAVIYLSSNYSSKKHLCSTILRGKHDHEIKEAAMSVREVLVKELAARKARQD
ncbi:MAG: hypothetical protein FWH44_05275 [Methanomassiliicoccaceae archaeon]|nr:hypothetical protein [Methanomassiliicoccaceae archaeon]